MTFDTALKPINKTAALVIGKGTHFNPKIKFNCHDERDTCPNVWEKLPTKNGLNLTGLKTGWLTVVGLSEEKKNRWVCRCVCGRYVFRYAKALRNSKNKNDKCITCNKIEWLSNKNRCNK
ncbi:MAG: hypothetical protein WC401_09625 [Bacteroidales bacterium]